MKFRHRRYLGILLASVLSLAPRLCHAAAYVPLDCTKVSTAAEATICKSYALGQDDARVATLFGILTSLVAMGQRTDLIDTQRRWISTRDACGNNEECLSGVYRSRINELSQLLDALAKRGPF